MIFSLLWRIDATCLVRVSLLIKANSFLERFIRYTQSRFLKVKPEFFKTWVNQLSFTNRSG